MFALIAQLRALEARAAAKSAEAKPLFDKRGQLLPRERVARLLDIGAPWLEALQHRRLRPRRAGPRQVRARRRHDLRHRLCLGHALRRGRERQRHRRGRDPEHGPREADARAGTLARQQAALRASGRVRGREPAQVPRRGLHPRRRDLPQPREASAAGVPVITVVHGSSTAGGAYMPGSPTTSSWCAGAPRRSSRARRS